MALPPDPIDEVLPNADAAVMGEVTRVIHSDPAEPEPKHEPGATSVPSKAPKQVVELRVDEVLFGPAQKGSVLEVVKPAGAYALMQGNKGPFLIRGAGKKDAEILGRYGPDTYSRRYIEDTAKKLGRA